MTFLLDSSMAIALLADDHEHYATARVWLSRQTGPVATCPITQGAVVRYVIRRGRTVESALSVVRSLTSLDRHEFWPDDIDYLDVRLDGVIGHRQVTDAYLAQLARRHGGRVATFDTGFAALHDDVTELVSA